MASVFSYHASSFPYSSDSYDQLNQSPRPSHRFHSAHPIPHSNSTVEPIRLRIATIESPVIRNTFHPFVEPWQTTPTGPRRNQGGFMTSSNKLRRGVLMLLIGLSIIGFIGPSSATAEGTAVSLPVETVADYLYAVIEADREVYTKHVVERMQIKGVVVASENWEEKNTLPLPAQFLMESGRVMARKGIGVQYRLISLWPINKRNVARSEFEKEGLGTILTHQTKPYTGFVKEGGARYFQAVYPDLAVTQACIGCHNSHPDSPKRDFKINDVMGAIVISIPVK